MTATATAPLPTLYISVVETAKLVRKALKDAFPNQKFSVRSSSYSGGASIRVTYDNDTLVTKDVEEVARQFEGAKFDGMIDLKEYVTHEVDGRKVSYGADYIFVTNEADYRNR